MTIEKLRVKNGILLVTNPTVHVTGEIVVGAGATTRAKTSEVALILLFA